MRKARKAQKMPVKSVIVKEEDGKRVNERHRRDAGFRCNGIVTLICISQSHTYRKVLRTFV